MALVLGAGSAMSAVVTTISSLDDWKSFVSSVKNGDNYSGITVTLTANFEIPSGQNDFANVYEAGTTSQPFTGTFDGGGYTITYTKTGLSEDYQALFRYVNGATIKNLRTSGELSSSGTLVAGIIGNAIGSVTLDNCSCDMTLSSSNSSNCRIGGLVARCAESGASLTVSNCMFNGSISAGQAGRAIGIVGWCNSSNSINISSCFLNPKSVTNAGNRFVPQSIDGTTIKVSNSWFMSGLSFTSNTGGSEATTARLISGLVAYDLQNNQATQYWGHSNLNRSNVASLPEMTNNAAKKVIKITFSHNGALAQYANAGGALPSPTSTNIKALSYYAGGDNDPYTSLSVDTKVYRNYAKYSLTVGDAGATTLVLPVAVSSLPSGVTAYKLTYDGGNKLTATKVNSITANEPVLINAAAGTYVFVSTNSTEITYATTAQQNGVLWGVYPADPYEYVPANTSGSGDDYYVLQNGSSGLGFYKVAAENKIRITAFRAYAKFTYSAPSAREFFSIDFDNTTDIQKTKTQLEESNAPIYNLSGQRVGNDYKGVVIQNGKKFVVK